MSSLIGHVLAGASAYLACNRGSDKRALRALPIFVLLAICPDFDYFAVWFLNYQAAPRISHSLLFCLVTALAAWLCSASWRRAGVAHLPFWALVIASASHPLLDLLVGAHPLPLLWPLPNPDVTAPIGVLPSAGQLRLTNYYLWRNLFIELAILLPVAVFLIAVARHYSVRSIAFRTLLVAPVWLLFVVWSIGLSR